MASALSLHTLSPYERSNITLARRSRSLGLCRISWDVHNGEQSKHLIRDCSWQDLYSFHCLSAWLHRQAHKAMIR